LENDQGIDRVVIETEIKSPTKHLKLESYGESPIQ